MSSLRIDKDKEWNPNWFELEDFRLPILAWSLGFTGWWWGGQYSELDWAWNKLCMCVCGCKFSLHKYKDLIKVTFIFYNFWWTFLTCLFNAPWCILWNMQTLQLYIVWSPEWNIFMWNFRFPLNRFVAFSTINIFTLLMNIFNSGGWCRKWL